MTPHDFIVKWGKSPAAKLNERQGAQAHFMDLCALLEVPTPGSSEDYVFEKSTLVIGEARGFADVFKRKHFAWENKAPGKNLDEALRQLRNYSMTLGNPPLLVVCDRIKTRIHTAFNGHPTEVHVIQMVDLLDPEKRALLRRVWTDVESFRPKITSRDITEAAAKSFATLADQLRRRGNDAQEVSHFLTQCLFCFFADDVGLLPERCFERLVNARLDTPSKEQLLPSEKLAQIMHALFHAMQIGGMFGAHYLPRFNGGLFEKVSVPKLEIMDVTELRRASALDWSAIDVSIFGTLFERGLDPSKRSQLGAHYTDPATIGRIIEPVLQRPLLQIWADTKADLQAKLAKSKKKGDAHYKAAQTSFASWLEHLSQFRVLDPACGSGNFLFLGLKALKDIEHQSHLEASQLGLDMQQDLVTGPHNMLGIELNEYAAELARLTVWIGELQWRLTHGYEFKIDPVLDPLDNIDTRDALIKINARSGIATEATWPRASIVIGNPPFLGGSKKRRELGDDYFKALDRVFAKRVPGGADLVCYWFDKARQQLAHAGLGAAGFVATQSIRSGSNRKVLDAIAKGTRIFDAWADEPWVNDGAAVRVSIISFGWGECCFLNGQPAARVASDLSGDEAPDLTVTRSLAENAARAFKGAEKSGAFDVDGSIARKWLLLPNPHNKSNSLVLKPWRNGADLADRCNDHWVIDFGIDTSESDASFFEAPFAHVVSNVRSARLQNADKGRRKHWWRFGRNGADLRSASVRLTRWIATPRVAKHRYFTWLCTSVSPDSRLFVIADSSDTTFGVLSSRIHEAWSLSQASIHGDGTDGGRPTYNAKSCFETFPFPPGLTPADTAHQRTELLAGGARIPADLPDKITSPPQSPIVLSATEIVVKTPPKPARRKLASQSATPQASSPLTVRQAAIAIAQAAKQLNDYRETWLNPPEWTQRLPEVVPHGMDTSPYPERIVPRLGFEKQLEARTLTKLYNQRPAWLVMAHHTLDVAVAAAYGWADYSAETPDDEILKRLLALNLERAGATTKPAPPNDFDALYDAIVPENAFPAVSVGSERGRESTVW